MDSVSGKINDENSPSLILIEETPEQAPLVVAAFLSEDEPEEAAQPSGIGAALASIKSGKAAAKPKAVAPAAEVIAIDVAEEPAAAPAIAPASEAAPAAAAPVATAVEAHEAHESHADEEEGAPAKPAGKFARLRFNMPLPVMIISLAVVASSCSVIGTLVASRMVARTNAVLEEVEAHQSKMRRLDALIDEVDGLRQREQIALVRLEQINAGKPATSAEVRSAIGGLQMSLAKASQGGSSGMMTMLRDGQAELADRVSTVYRKVERIDQNVGAMVNANPKARHAADPKPTS